MKSTYWLIVLGWLATDRLHAQNKIELLPFDAKALPVAVEYRGTILDGKRWKDSNGENYFILSRTADKIETIDGVQKKTAFIYGFHYAGSESAYQLLRKIAEPLKECAAPLSDIYLLEQSLSVTDNDNDGKAEVAFLHATVCNATNDDPIPVQLTLLEDGERYTMLGTAAVVLAADNRATGGTAGTEVQKSVCNVGAEFKNADPLVLQFADQHWKKYAVKKK